MAGRLIQEKTMKQPAVYIMANKQNGTLYAGVTSDLMNRIQQHKNGVADGFTKKYGCTMLVFYEIYDKMEDAITREKQIKAGSRKNKLTLIENMNFQWRDLYQDIII
jgi:putative endonuclease